MTGVQPRLARSGRHDRGAAALETALVVPVVLLLTGAVLLMGLRTVYASLAEHSARVAARHATIRQPTYPTEAQVEDAAANAVPAGLLGRPAVRYDRPGVLRQGQRVVVTVRYDVPVLRFADLLVPGVDMSRLAVIERTATGRLE